MSRKLLLIDDDADLADLLREFLRRNAYAMTWADRPSRGWEELAAGTDLVLLDVMLPEYDGFEFCRRLREQGHRVPVIMLTARGDDLDRIHGLRTGADDYLPKPFNPVELLARVEAVLRRMPVALPTGSRLDPDRRVLVLADREIGLTPTEFKLLEALMAVPGRAFSRSRLLELLDEAGESDSFDRAIDIHVSRLRGKLEPDPKQPRHLLTVRGLGYRWAW